MTDRPNAATPPPAAYPPVPPDNPRRMLAAARADDPRVSHVGLAGGTYTILLTGDDTAGRYALIDMLVPPGGGPGPHRHDFEESFTVLDGAIEVTFRDRKSIAHVGETVNIPANAPHRFQNISDRAARLLCVCAPAGQEQFFREVGVPVATRTEAPPTMDANARADFMAKAAALAPQYRTELL